MQRTQGLTLLELMIVLVIMAVLAGLAYPQYTDSIVRSRRSDGQFALLDLANRLEQYYLEKFTYETATINRKPETDVLTNSISAQGFYTLAIVSQDAFTYTIHAIPRGGQGTSDTHCQTLTLDHLGVKGITTGPMGAPRGQTQDCWR